MVRHSNAQAVTIAAVGDIFEDPVVGAALPIVAKNAEDRIPRHRTERHDAARDIAAVKAFRNDEALIGYDLLPVFLGSRGVEQDIHAQISDVILLFADENSFVVQMKRAPGASAFQGAGVGAYGRGLQMQQDGILYLAAQSFDRSTPLRQMLCVKQAVGFDLFCLSLTFESLEAVLDLGASLFASGDENVAGGMVSRADAAFQFGGLAAVKGALAVFRLHESAQFLRAHACQTLFLVPLRADALAAVYIARMIGKAEPEFPVTALDGLSFSESERDPTLLSFRFLFLQTDLKPAFKEIPRPFNDLFRAHVPGKLQLVEQIFRIGIQFVFQSQRTPVVRKRHRIVKRQVVRGEQLRKIVFGIIPAQGLKNRPFLPLFFKDSVLKTKPEQSLVDVGILFCLKASKELFYLRIIIMPAHGPDNGVPIEIGSRVCVIGLEIRRKVVDSRGVPYDVFRSSSLKVVYLDHFSSKTSAAPSEAEILTATISATI